MWAGHQIHDVPGREETSVRGVLQGLAIHGHCSEQVWPYGAPHYAAGRPLAAQAAVNQRACPDWSALHQLTVAEDRGRARTAASGGADVARRAERLAQRRAVRSMPSPVRRRPATTPYSLSGCSTLRHA